MWFSKSSKERARLKQDMHLVMRGLDAKTVRIDVLSNALNTFKENLNAQWEIIEAQKASIEILSTKLDKSLENKNDQVQLNNLTNNLLAAKKEFREIMERQSIRVNNLWKTLNVQDRKIEELASLITILDHIPGQPSRNISEIHAWIMGEDTSGIKNEE